MKTLGKILLAGAGMGILGFLIRREYKKSVNRQEQEDKRKENELVNAGIDPERFDKEVEPGTEDENLVKTLYMSVDTEIDTDIIDVQNCIDNDNVIHVRQFDIEGRDKTIDFLFEIPESSSERGNFSVPKIADYIKAFMKKKDELEKKLKQQIRTGLEGYFVVRYTNEEGHSILGTARIPKEIYLPFAHGKNDGLVDYIDQMRSKNFKNIDLSGFKIIGATDVEILDIKLLFKLSLCRELISLSTLKEVLLKELIDFEVERQSSNYVTPTVYNYVMFNAYGPAGNWSLLHYYTYRKGEGVVIEDYEY